MIQYEDISNTSGKCSEISHLSSSYFIKPKISFKLSGTRQQYIDPVKMSGW